MTLQNLINGSLLQLRQYQQDETTACMPMPIALQLESSGLLNNVTTELEFVQDCERNIGLPSFWPRSLKVIRNIF